jgi:predicted ABC-type ATPase
VRRRAPSLERLLADALAGQARPTAFVLAGHNGSGKSTLWYERLAAVLQMPLINADRLITSILPRVDRISQQLPGWAQRLRDDDLRWQQLAQGGVRAFKQLVMTRCMPFAYETVFSHWRPRPGGEGFESKADDILAMQAAGYFVVLLFVGLTSADMSVLRVQTRLQKGGHGVPLAKLVERFPRTQQAIGHAAPLADMTLMFDNSRTEDKAFALVRAQRREAILFDVRDPAFKANDELRHVATPWLDRVAGVRPHHPPDLAAQPQMRRPAPRRR